MSDVFEEVNDDLRRENMEKLWKKYGPWVIALCVLVVAIVGGSKAFESYQLSKAVNASNAYIEYVSALNAEGNASDKGQTEFKAVQDSGHTGYIYLSQMSKASALAANNSTARAVILYDLVAANTSLSQNNRDIATVLAGYLLVDTASLQDVIKHVETINVVENAFRFQAREQIGLSAFRAGDFKLSSDTFLELSQNAQTPDSIRARANQIVALLVSKL
ncbi:MAG: tetratricopeptide repeat protein [Rhizobiales bacterium]|nr:tetratricopeptide repeat protein [Hyphomicrobiales bacterium]NRB13013.1 tetratricopeptide repeat protein [Hyphomicrobiales bacterium]